MSNEKILPYAVVCGGVNIDIGAHSFAPLRAKDSNPGKVELSLGGVGRNIAHNMRLLGVPTYLLTAVGGDSRASQVEESCKELGIDLSHALRVPNGRTSTYVFVGDSDGDMAVAVADMEICEKLTPDYFASQQALLDGAAAVVIDANLPRESIAYLVEHCAAPLFVDPVSTVKAEKLQGLLSHVHTLKPNRIEAELLSGVKITDNATLHQAAQALLDQGVQRVFLSLGGDGVFAAQQGETHLEPICKAEMRNATGAGDAMMASLVWSFLAGRDLAERCAAGTAAAAIAQAASLTASPQIRNIATVGGNIMQDRRCIYFNQPHLWRSGLAYCFKTGGSICHQIPNSPVCRAIYYSDVATALIAYEAEVEYIEDGETHRTDLASLIERHSVANGLACHEHLPILVTRFFVPAAEEGERSGFYKYAMRTTIDFPIINFALRCGGNRPARLAAGAVAPHPVVMAETAAKIDSDATDDEVIAQAEDELRKLAMPIKEACMPPAVKRSLDRHVAMLLNLRK